MWTDSASLGQANRPSLIGRPGPNNIIKNGNKLNQDQASWKENGKTKQPIYYSQIYAHWRMFPLYKDWEAKAYSNNTERQYKKTGPH